MSGQVLIGPATLNNSPWASFQDYSQFLAIIMYNMPREGPGEYQSLEGPGLSSDKINHSITTRCANLDTINFFSDFLNKMKSLLALLQLELKLSVREVSQTPVCF